MSLPYYEPTKYDYKTKEEGSPSKFEVQVPILAQRDITFYVRHWSEDVICFTSPDAPTKYESFKIIKKRDANFKHVVDLQQLGIGLPLMEAKFKPYFGLDETKFATIFKCIPPPPGSNRTFNEKKDKFEFCTVRKKREWHHTRYTFTILPNHNNRSDIFKFSMFVHSKLPIIDVSPIRGSPRRYRWIIGNRRRYCKDAFSYGLYLLEDKQESMVDNMDVANQKLDNANNILNGTSIETRGKLDPQYLHKTGEVVMFRCSGFDPKLIPDDMVGILSREKGGKITMTMLKEGKKLPHVSQPQEVDLESIDSVGVHELALTCMSYVLNFIEEIKYRCENT